jgi:hypothetical protein
MPTRDTSTSFSPPDASLPELPADRAFVVQFRGQAPAQALRVAGRVEHVVSGQTMEFDSWDQLRRFVEETLGHRRSR